MTKNYKIICTKRNHYRMTWAEQSPTGLHPIVTSEFEITGGKAGLKNYIERWKRVNPNDTISVID